MALFVTAIPTLRSSMCDHMLAAAQDLLTTARDACGELPLGVGLNCGTAWSATSVLPTSVTSRPG